MAATEELAAGIGFTAPACTALGVPRASLYRRRRPQRLASRPRPRPHRSLRPEEQRQVLDVLRSPQFVDKSQAQAWASLLDDDIYYCSIRTMYRLLAAHGESRGCGHAGDSHAVGALVGGGSLNANGNCLKVVDTLRTSIQRSVLMTLITVNNGW